MAARIRRLSVLVASFVALLGAQGCDTSGIHPLNSPIDRTTNCGRSTWLRTTDTGTEVFQLGEVDPTTPVVDVCFVRAFVEIDSSTVLEQGTYTLDASGVGTFNVETVYTFVYEPDKGPLSRIGAGVNDNPDPASHAITIAKDGAETLISVDGTARRLTNIYDVITRLDPTTFEGAEDVYRLYNLSLFTSQVRVLAFGGAGMTMYLAKKEFSALVAGEFSVAVESVTAPKTTISYMDYEDLHGIWVNGDQVTQINPPSFNGDGYMTGALDFEMRASDDVNDVFLSGSIGYENCVIDSGVGAGGTYTVTIDADPQPLVYDVSYMLASDSDLRGLLAPSTP